METDAKIAAAPAAASIATAVAPDHAVEIGRGALFIGFAKAFFMVSGFLQRTLLAHLVSPAEYGAFALVNNVVSTVNNTMVQGTIQTVSKFTAEDDARAAAVRRAGLRMQAVVATVVGLGFLFAAPAIAGFVNAPETYVNWFRVVAAIPFLYGFYAVFVGSANGLRRFRTQAAFDVTFSSGKTVLVLGGAAVGAAIGSRVTGALVGFVLAAAAILVVAAMVMRTSAPAGESFPMRRLTGYMGGVVAYTLLINLALNYDLVLVRRFAGAVAVSARADMLAGNYEAMRSLGLLPYQALMVVTFVIFPLVSRSTFAEDFEATRAYVTQTLRYALLLAAGLGVVLAARPATVLSIIYPKGYGEGAAALPILVAGVCCLALLGVAGAIINASGRPAVAVMLLAFAVAIGAATSVALVPSATPGPDMLVKAALATSAGMVAGLGGALFYLRRRFAASPPPLTVLRIAVALGGAVIVGRLVPGVGKAAGLAALAATGIAYAVALVATGEFSATDRAKFRKILRR